MKIICVIGPTASGKSALAIEIAKKCNGEIVNADSRQFYTELNIGTAKPGPAELAAVPHHLINISSIDNALDVADFVRLADAAIVAIRSRGRLPVVVGGTGMYVQALLFGIDEIPAIDDKIRHAVREDIEHHGLTQARQKLEKLDPKAAARLDVFDKQRTARALEVVLQTGNKISDYWSENKKPRYDYLKIGLEVDRAILYERINARVDAMLAAGLKSEVSDLVKNYPQNDLVKKTIGYAEWLKLGFDDEAAVAEAIKMQTRRFAKRQLTWFRHEADIQWFGLDQHVEVLKNVVNFVR